MMRRGSLILEVVVAMALSSFVMLGMIQSYRNAVRVLSRARRSLTVNRRVGFLFNQVERDITSAFVCDFSANESLKKENTPDKKRSDTQKKSEKKYNAQLEAHVFDDTSYLVRKRARKMLQLVSFVTANPLEVYGTSTPRIVRVGYQLRRDRSRSEKGKPHYELIRKETDDLKNVLFKEKDADNPQVRSHVVARDLKACSLRFAYEKKKDENQKNDDEELLKTFVWDQKIVEKKSARPLPTYVTLHVELWDEERDRAYPFECMIPFFVTDANKKKDAETGTPQKGQPGKKNDAKGAPNEAPA